MASIPVETIDGKTQYAIYRDGKTGTGSWVLAHEVGHLIDNGPFGGSDDPAYQHFLRQGGPLESWGSPVESYAECFAHYVENPANLAGVDHEVYDYFDSRLGLGPQGVAELL